MKRREEKKKDLGELVELGVSKKKAVGRTRPRSFFRNELFRIGLAELLCTYVMMVRSISQHEMRTCSALQRRKMLLM